jgi:hypothetical protein
VGEEQNAKPHEGEIGLAFSARDLTALATAIRSGGATSRSRATSLPCGKRSYTCALRSNEWERVMTKKTRNFDEMPSF